MITVCTSFKTITFEIIVSVLAISRQKYLIPHVRVQGSDRSVTREFLPE